MSLYDIITDQIISKLSEGVIPWKTEWKCPLQQNFVSNQPYRGINQLLTSSQGYKSPYWLTFNQAKKMNINIKKYERSTIVVYFQIKEISKRLEEVDYIMEDEKKHKKTKPIMRYYRIFNLEQTDYPFTEREIPEMNKLKKPETIINTWANVPLIKHAPVNPHYSVSMDSVFLPDMKYFHSAENYYSTLFHELIHSTGHPERLNRKELTNIEAFADSNYAKEELIAEIGSAFLCSIAGITQEVINNQTAYINSWIDKLQNDKTLIVKAANNAQKAVDYIFENTKDNVKNYQELQKVS